MTRTAGKPLPSKGITPELVVDAALRLSRQHGLNGWRMRQLSDAIGAYPAVIYHHVGDRAAVVDQVLMRVAAEIRVPPKHRGDTWKDWVLEVADELRRVLTRYPGAADGLALASMSDASRDATLLRRATAVLAEAGFEDPDQRAAQLINLVCILVGADDAAKTAGGTGRFWSHLSVFIDGLEATLTHRATASHHAGAA